jgi:hypothetical protein
MANRSNAALRRCNRGNLDYSKDLGGGSNLKGMVKNPLRLEDLLRPFDLLFWGGWFCLVGCLDAVGALVDPSRSIRFGPRWRRH